MCCEEGDGEVNHRMQEIARHLDSTRHEMIEHGLRILSFAGRNAVLAQPDPHGSNELVSYQPSPSPSSEPTSEAASNGHCGRCCSGRRVRVWCIGKTDVYR
jgi:hypothetical protein